MSSAFFRRPGDDSSESDSSSDADAAEIEEPSTKNSDNNSSSVDLELATTESLPSYAGFAATDTDADGTIQNAEQHKNNMFAALLEDYYKTRAAEFLNSTTPGAHIARDAPEVQTLAHRLYLEASKTLVQTGIIPTAEHPDQQSRQNSQYLSALDSLAYKTMKGGSINVAPHRYQLEDHGDKLALVRASAQEGFQQMGFVEDTMAKMVMNAGRMSISSPHADMALTVSHAKQHSHYESSFQQLKLLGKGGFGKVYHAHSIFDRKEYAIKKIPLSPRLTTRYQQGGHDELESVLREVQALAQLDHRNVVRYHATWIEEPKSSPRSGNKFSHIPPLSRQRLLADRPHGSSSSQPSVVDPSEGIVFGFDSSRRASSEHPLIHGWSNNDSHDQSTSVRESQLFTDGFAKGSASTDSSLDDTVCVLHVQMSLYPMNLAQYLAPIAPSASSILASPPRRHCFHLVPSLRILIGIICGLQYIHAKGLVHRDIKPGNIFLSTMDHTVSLSATGHEGYYDVGSCSTCPLKATTPPATTPFHINPRIGDFGLVAELARSDISIDTLSSSPMSTPSSPSKPVGTEYYRPPALSPNSPSVGEGKSPGIDEKIDVYALGVIFVELLWRCDTASERMHVLRDLQRGKLPRGFVGVLDAEFKDQGFDTGIGVGDMVRECIKGMLERDSRHRWGLKRVRERVVEILRLTGEDGGLDSAGAGTDTDLNKDRNRDLGPDLAKVRSLTGTEADSEPMETKDPSTTPMPTAVEVVET